MRFIVPIVLAVAALASATPMNDDKGVPAARNVHDEPVTLAARKGESLELYCQDTSAFCCDKLRKGDEDPAEAPGTGAYRNCAPVSNFGLTACELKKTCKRTPACCDYPEIGGPIPSPMGCRDLRSILKEEKKEHLLVCKATTF
ncbi:hypothetical protein ACJ41O_003587 [Fusarium nematophilum]